MQYLAVIEPTGDGRWEARIPDLPGCSALAATQEEAIARIRDAIAPHTQRLTDAGKPIPAPASFAIHVRP